MMRSVWSLAVLGWLLIVPSVVRAQLPTGTWKVNATGFEGELVIKSVNDGKVEGTIFGDAITGSYEEKTKCLSFLRLQEKANQGYKGYLFSKTVGGDVHYSLAGTFQAFYVSGDGRTEFGWYATITKAKE